MMAGFDPDAYLATSSSSAAPSFDPDAYLARPSVGADIAKSGGIGLAKGAIGLAGSLGDAMTLGHFLVDKGAGLLGVSPETIAGAKESRDRGYSMVGTPPTSQGIQSAIEKQTGKFYEPQTVPGQYAQTIGEFAPAGAVGPGGFSRRIAQTVLPAIASETAGQATQGTAAEPYARVAAALAGGALPAAFERSAAAAIPTAAKLKQAGSQGFEQARNLGVEIKPQSVTDFATRVRQDLETRLGVDENLAPKTFGILSKIETAPAGSVATVNNLQSLRRTLGNAAGSIDKNERLAATSAKGALDDYLANLPAADIIKGDPQAASALLREANANYAAAERSNAVNAKIVRAELRAAAANSGQNVANMIRQRMADILINPGLQRGYSKDELAQIEKIVRGTAIGNTARFAKNVFGGGGGLGTLATGAVGAAAGGPAGLALAAPGIAGRLISDASTMHQVSKLDQMLRSRAPLSQVQAAAAPAIPQDRLTLLRRLLLASPATLPMRFAPVPQFQQ